MEEQKVIILYSGGYDSTLLLELAIRLKMKVHCLIIGYGQVHEEELQVATDYCTKKHIKYSYVSVPLGDLAIKSKLLDGSEDHYQGVSEWHVPSRNLIFISLAATVAESKGIDLIWFGANYNDRENLFPDCYQEWVYEVNKLMRINGSKPIRVEAPLLGMSKPLIEGMASQFFGIEKEEVFSGYGTSFTFRDGS